MTEKQRAHTQLEVLELYGKVEGKESILAVYDNLDAKSIAKYEEWAYDLHGIDRVIPIPLSIPKN